MRTDVEAYRECFRRGLESGEFYVGKLKADPEGIPPWGTHHLDWIALRGHGRDSARARMKILDRLPIQDRPTSLRFGGKYTTVRRDQVLLWMSVHVASRCVKKAPRGPRYRSSRPCWIPETTSASRCRNGNCASGPGLTPRLLAILGDAEINGQSGEPTGGNGLAVPEHPRPAGRGQRPAAVAVADGQRDCYLRAGHGSDCPAVAPSARSLPRPPRQRPRLVARSRAAKHHRAVAHLAQAPHASSVPIVMRLWCITPLVLEAGKPRRSF